MISRLSPVAPRSPLPDTCLEPPPDVHAANDVALAPHTPALGTRTAPARRPFAVARAIARPEGAGAVTARAAALAGSARAPAPTAPLAFSPGGAAAFAPSKTRKSLADGGRLMSLAEVMRQGPARGAELAANTPPPLLLRRGLRVPPAVPLGLFDAALARPEPAPAGPYPTYLGLGALLMALQALLDAERRGVSVHAAQHQQLVHAFFAAGCTAELLGYGAALGGPYYTQRLGPWVYAAQLGAAERGADGRVFAQVWDDLCAADHVDLYVANAALAACARRGARTLGARVLAAARQRGLRPDGESYVSLLQLAPGEGPAHLQACTALLEEARAAGVGMDAALARETVFRFAIHGAAERGPVLVRAAGVTLEPKLRLAAAEGLLAAASLRPQESDALTEEARKICNEVQEAVLSCTHVYARAEALLDALT